MRQVRVGVNEGGIIKGLKLVQKNEMSAVYSLKNPMHFGKSLDQYIIQTNIFEQLLYPLLFVVSFTSLLANNDV